MITIPENRFKTIFSITKWMLFGLILFCVIYIFSSFYLFSTLTSISGGYGDNAENSPETIVNFPEGFETFDASDYETTHYQELIIPSKFDWVQISAWYYPAPKKNAPGVILTHGYDNSKAASQLLIIARMLQRNGFHAVIVDLRDHGLSSKENGRTELGKSEYKDILSARYWLHDQHGVPLDQIGLFGGSMGGATTLYALTSIEQIPAVFLDSPYARLDWMVKEELKRLGYPSMLYYGGALVGHYFYDLDLMNNHPEDGVFTSTETAFFLLHSQQDARVGIHHSRQLEEQMPSTNILETLYVDTPGHVKYIFQNPSNYEHHLVKFFKTTLTKPSPTL